jgi:hypothetical protein
VTGHEGGQGGGASLGDLKLSGVTLGAKEKEGGDRVENQELGAEPLQKGAKDRAATRIDLVRDLVRIPRRSRAIR